MKRLLAGLAVLALTGCSAGTFHVTGTLELNSARAERIWNVDGCPLSSGGYADIATGTQVTGYDAGGKVVAVGALKDSAAVGDVDVWTSQCTFAFDVAGVPEGSAIYSIEVANRGKASLNRAALRSAVHLRLGS